MGSEAALEPRLAREKSPQASPSLCAWGGHWLPHSYHQAMSTLTLSGLAEGKKIQWIQHSTSVQYLQQDKQGEREAVLQAVL